MTNFLKKNDSENISPVKLAAGILGVAAIPTIGAVVFFYQSVSAMGEQIKTLQRDQDRLVMQFDKIDDRLRSIDNRLARIETKFEK